MSARDFFKMVYGSDRSIRDLSGLEVIVDIGTAINEEVRKAMDKENIKKVEELMEKMELDAYISSSPHTGEPISAIRLHDVYDILCKGLGVDPKSTRYEYYG